MTLLDRVHALLVSRRVPHALIGAAALAVHGVSRATFDQDLLVTDRRVLGVEFWSGIGADVRADVRVADADDPLAGVVRVSADTERDVDVVVGRQRWQEAVLADVLLVGDQQLPVVSAVGLILLKLYAGGTQDRWDMAQLLAVQPVTLLAEVDAQVVTLPTRSRELWRSLRADISG